MSMILSLKAIEYFKTLGSKVLSSMAIHKVKTPYFIPDEPIINHYEAIRAVWLGSSTVQQSCLQFNISRTHYYQIEKCFINKGIIGLFSLDNTISQDSDLEELSLLIKDARPSLSQIAIHRIAQAIPVTSENSDIGIISRILNSHGYTSSSMASDVSFWRTLQRILERWRIHIHDDHSKNKIYKRRLTFYSQTDVYQHRIECLRELFYSPQHRVIQICKKHNIDMTTYYRIVDNYHRYGPWAIISARNVGKGAALDSQEQLTILITKLGSPFLSAQEIQKQLEIKSSRYAINRLIKRWGLEDKNRPAISLTNYCDESSASDSADQQHKPIQTAMNILSEKRMFDNFRINRHFNLCCKKMNTHAYNICDPGPIILAPFLSNLGISQAFEVYGPPKLRGKEITNLALLNVLRILAGYRRVNHLGNNRDRSVAFACGLGLFGSSSRFYQDTIEFKFDQIHSMRLDLVARAKELGLIEGIKIAFDFHFKKYFGKGAFDKSIGKGPDKAGNIVPGFRPHIAWDLTTNTILNIAYYQGAVRGANTIEDFCRLHIFPLFDPLAIQEIYMDSEYTKEMNFYFFKQTIAKDGHVYMCLKQNKQIKKIITPAIADTTVWKEYDQSDDYAVVSTILSKTKLPLVIVVLRDKIKKDNIRCFGTTKKNIPAQQLLEKYRYRWNIENGIKDLVYSYYIDEITGQDPERIDFEFYCVMVARLTYEYFLKMLGDKYYQKEDGNKYTLNSMRNILFEKRNSTIHQNSQGDIVLTLLDTKMDEVLFDIKCMLEKMKNEGKNKVLWWNNRSLVLKVKDQFQSISVK